MKRLIDESPDELTRSLLQAGIEHRPPSGSQGRLLVALGAGGAVGLMSSKAFAWWGSTAGKLTVASLSIGVAGVVYAGLADIPEPRIATGALQAAVRDVPVQPVADPWLPKPAASSPALPEATAHGANPDGVAPVTTEALAPDVNAAEQNSARLPKNVRAFPLRKAREEKARVNAETAPAALGLDTEVEWVDAMRSAVRHGDRDRLGQLLERYRAAFPEGQLRQEVAELASGN